METIKKELNMFTLLNLEYIYRDYLSRFFQLILAYNIYFSLNMSKISLKMIQFITV